MKEENLATTIITLEKAALEEWNKGNPTGYLNLYSEDFTYFGPIQRISGFEKIKELYESARGNIQVEKYEIIEPVVQIYGETAVLSYNLMSQAGGEQSHWHCTGVYQQQPDKQWKIIHQHWSMYKTEN
jgi:ketosteroid isomerase-like protein